MKPKKKRFKLVVNKKKKIKPVKKAEPPKPAKSSNDQGEDMDIDIVDDGKIDIMGDANPAKSGAEEASVKKKRTIKFKSQRKEKKPKMKSRPKLIIGKKRKRETDPFEKSIQEIEKRQPVEITEEIKLCTDCLSYFWKGPHADETWAGYMSEIQNQLTKLKICLDVGQVSSAHQFRKIFLDIFHTMETEVKDRIRDRKATMATYLRYRFETIYKYKVKILLPNFKPKLCTIKDPDALVKIVDDLLREPEAPPFKCPVDPLANNLLGYFYCVTKPVCLDDVRKHILYKLYSNLDEFKKDVEMVFVNAQRFFNNSKLI